MKTGELRQKVRSRLSKSDTGQLLIDQYRRMRVVEKSPFDNIFHCCTQKTASVAFMNIFNDPEVYYYTGLNQQAYHKLGLREAEFVEPFPVGTIASKLYVDFPTYDSIPKTDNHRTFFVLRDPRDIVVSWYYSMKYSHVDIGPVGQFRSELQDLDQQQGLLHCVDTLEEIGLFEAQRSWMEIPENQKEFCKVFRYEHFASDHHSFLAALFDFLEINIPPAKFEQVCERHSFESKTRGRKQGEENLKSHNRKGVSGDWIEHFDGELNAYFERVTGDLVQCLGYS